MQEHEHQFGEMEHAWMTGNPHRKCQIDGCRVVSLDFDDDETDDDDEIPADYPVRPIAGPVGAKDPAQCGTCGRWWDDGIVTGMTPAPSARCPFEPFHGDVVDDDYPVELYDELLAWAQTHGIFALPETPGGPREAVARVARLIRDNAKAEA